MDCFHFHHFAPPEFKSIYQLDGKKYLKYIQSRDIDIFVNRVLKKLIAVTCASNVDNSHSNTCGKAAH